MGRFSWSVSLTALVLSACGRFHYDASALDAGLDARGPDADLDAFGPDAPIDAPLAVDAAAPIDTADLDAATDAFAPDAFACSGTDRVVDGRCVPFVSQLDLDDDGFGDLVIGAQNAPTMAAGAAFFYRGSPTGPTRFGAFRAANPDERVGFTTLDAHDVNGDGTDDVIVSGHNYMFGQAYVFHGGSSPIDVSVATLGYPEATQFGQFMAALGDRDGDGFAEVVVAEDGSDRAHLFEGVDATGLPIRPIVTFSPPSLLDLTSGDVDGDGRVDLLVRGVNGADGRVFVYRSTLMSSSLPAPTIAAAAGTTYTSFTTAHLTGGATADLVVGTSNGEMLVYRGGAGGPSTTPSATISAPSGATGFAAIVRNVGDLDHDGDDDLAVAENLADATRVFVYLGQSAAPFALEGRAITLPPASGRTRVSLGASDVDGDGEAEVIVGDPLRQHVYCYTDPTGARTLAFDLEDTSATSFGFSVASR